MDIANTGTASHMRNILGAVRLLGAEGIITGIRPSDKPRAHARI
ncbi:hypothetical protein [Polyangium jinanense]|nr:hypothetical protein [Polyangium jinanense]